MLTVNELICIEQTTYMYRISLLSSEASRPTSISYPHHRPEMCFLWVSMKHGPPVDSLIT